MKVTQLTQLTSFRVIFVSFHYSVAFSPQHGFSSARRCSLHSERGYSFAQFVVHQKPKNNLNSIVWMTQAVNLV